MKLINPTLEQKINSLAAAHNKLANQYMLQVTNVELKLKAVIDSMEEPQRFRFEVTHFELRLQNLLMARNAAQDAGHVQAYTLLGRQVSAMEKEAAEAGFMEVYLEVLDEYEKGENSEAANGDNEEGTDGEV